jgi:hypothetical protein
MLLLRMVSKYLLKWYPYVQKYAKCHRNTEYKKDFIPEKKMYLYKIARDTTEYKQH